jgi:hypothetical protein
LLAFCKFFPTNIYKVDIFYSGYFFHMKLKGQDAVKFCYG